ncbi:MAG: hypothetical protein NZM12_03080 [Steroidobacteraceae bacterium]|nr:hypothetical protein [Steroidobacteraceae bacterium]MDW8259087.1 hypothetical protein [Gammaproteobacteria bacterium]
MKLAAYALAIGLPLLAGAALWWSRAAGPAPRPDPTSAAATTGAASSPAAASALSSSGEPIARETGRGAATASAENTASGADGASPEREWLAELFAEDPALLEVIDDLESPDPEVRAAAHRHIESLGLDVETLRAARREGAAESVVNLSRN